MKYEGGRSSERRYANRRRFHASKVFRASFRLMLAFACTVLAFQPLLAQQFRPPPLPKIRPLLSEAYANATNANHIDDQLQARARQAIEAERAAIVPGERVRAQARLAEMVDVELIFRDQITQPQIDAFLALGGEITYVYKAVSFGWNGRLPLRQVESAGARLGGSLLLMHEVKQAKLHLDTATRTGRVRPIWAAGFAGNASGFSGNTNITIATCDTGADESHTDLAGRRVYWHDFSTDGAASPIDLVQHGSHVMGIATGTGAASGSVTAPLFFTDENTLSGVPSGSFYPTPFDLPATPVTISMTSRWNGGGSTTLYVVYRTKGVSGGYTSQASITGSSPLTLTTTFTPGTSREYSPALLSNGAMTSYVTTCQVSNYPGVGDGFNRLRGVAPGCRWGCAKVFTSSGSGLISWTAAALDDLVANRVANNIKVINLSLGATGNPGLDPTTRQKVNTAVNNGIVVVASAGNDGGTSQVDDPGRAAMALTVAAANDVNQLTDYTSEGFSSPGSVPGQEEDYKPDLMAPGGSANYYSSILSVDSNSGDGGFSDQQPNDYYGLQGTSMASPFAAGCAALVIDALQQSGVAWDFSSSQHSRLVKMLLCATATESNTNREGNANNPTLQRAAAGPNGFPTGKDQYEGYGMINPDAAVEAVTLSYAVNSTATDTFGPTAMDRRAWARKVHLVGGQQFAANLTVPGSGDFDLYVYNWAPGPTGTPVLLASSTQVGSGVNEAISYLPAATSDALLVVKLVSGSGTFSFVGYVPPTANFSANPTNGVIPLNVGFNNLSVGSVSNTWVFGDGQFSAAVNPANTYSNAGSYTVSLTAVNPAGTNSLTRTNYIVVTNPSPPVVDFVAAPTNGLAPVAVTFTNLTSGTVTAYVWTFGDGNTSSSANPFNTYSNAGSYTVSLTAWNSGGTNTVTRTNYVVVTNLPPPVVAFAAQPLTGLAPLSTSFTNFTTGATAYSWGFGDGNSSSNANPSNLYTNAGSYTVTLTAWNSGGTNSLTRVNYIVATNPPAPVVNFTAGPTNGLRPLVVNFTNLTTGIVSAYSWNFGDGNSSSATSPTNNYTNAGSYIVTLTAWSSGGTNSLAFTNYVVVTNPPPPVANFVADVTNGLPSLIVNFTNLSSGATNFSWNFGDGNTSALINPANTFSNSGSYTIILTATGPGGTNTVISTNYVVVTNPPPPVASFVTDVTNGLVPLTVNFTNLSSGASNYLWNFGDGNTSALVNPANTYSSAGAYSVTLTAVGSGGTNSLVLSNYVVVTNPPPPVANFISDITNGLAPLTANFTNLSTDATAYAWNFGDGNISAGANPANTYSNAGTYTVILAASGPGGTNTLTITNYVVATNPPLPVANFVADLTNGLAPLAVNFTNLSSGATTYAWNFGDGNTSAGVNPANTYSNAGSYTITLVANGQGGTNSLVVSNYVVVTNPPPVANFVANVTNGLVPLTVDFTNLSSGATNYAWNFGDGNTTNVANPSNTYSNAGTYTVTLESAGPGGTNSLVLTNYLVVTNPPPPVANFVADLTNGFAPLTVHFTNLSIDALTFTWEFGDANTSVGVNPANTYSNSGIYNVTLTAIGVGGTNSLTLTNLILVLAPPRLVVAPPSLNFGVILTGATAQASFVISNAGVASLTGAVSVSASPFYLLDASSNAVSSANFDIPALDSTNILVGFAPLSAGTFSNVVVITSNGGASTNSLIGGGLIPPLLLSPHSSGADFIFSFATLPGRIYLVQFKDHLADPSWQTLQSVPGDGTTLSVTNLISTSAQRFFRLSVQ